MTIDHDELLAFLARKLRRASLDMDAEMGRTPGWDSMAQVNLILSIEERYGVQIPPDMFGQLASVRAIQAYLDEAAA